MVSKTNHLPIGVMSFITTVVILQKRNLVNVTRLV